MQDKQCACLPILDLGVLWEAEGAGGSQQSRLVSHSVQRARDPRLHPSNFLILCRLQVGQLPQSSEAKGTWKTQGNAEPAPRPSTVAGGWAHA